MYETIALYIDGMAYRRSMHISMRRKAACGMAMLKCMPHLYFSILSPGFSYRRIYLFFLFLEMASSAEKHLMASHRALNFRACSAASGAARKCGVLTRPMSASKMYVEAQSSFRHGRAVAGHERQKA